MELQELVDVVDDQHVAVLKVVVEGLKAGERDFLRVLHDGFGSVAAPLVGAADGPVAALLEDQEAFSFEGLADLGHHLADTLFGVGLLDADGDDVVDDFLAAHEALLLGLEVYLVALQVGRDGEYGVPALPRHEHVAL